MLVTAPRAAGEALASAEEVGSDHPAAVSAGEGGVRAGPRDARLRAAPMVVSCPRSSIDSGEHCSEGQGGPDASACVSHDAGR